MINRDRKPFIRGLGVVLAAVLLFSTWHTAAEAAQLTTIVNSLKKDDDKKTDIEKIQPSVNISDRVLIIQVGNINRLYAEIFPRNKASHYPVTWTSDHPEIVSVDQEGWLKGISPGMARVTVSISDENGEEISSSYCSVCILPNGDYDELAKNSENWTWKGFYNALARLQEHQGKPYPWKQILCIGDSVTAGVQSGSGRWEWVPNYPLTMAYHYDRAVYNRGVGGSSIWSHGNFSIKDSLDTFEKADAVFLMGGFNDWFYGEECAIGDLDTPGTFTYDFNALCDRIEELYGDKDIFVILPYTPHDHLGNEPYYDFSWLKAVEREIAEAHDFNLINLPADNILNGLEKDTYETFFSDYVHMNDLGYIVLGTYIANKALEIKEGTDD